MVQSVDALIDEMEALAPTEMDSLPSTIEDELSLRPAWALSLIRYLSEHEQSTDTARKRIVCRLLSDALAQILYCIDRNDKRGMALSTEVEATLQEVMPELSTETAMQLNQIVFESTLPICIDAVNMSRLTKNDPSTPHIMPQLPELLERLKREKHFKTTFELYSAARYYMGDDCIQLWFLGVLQAENSGRQAAMSSRHGSSDSVLLRFIGALGHSRLSPLVGPASGSSYCFYRLACSAI